MCLTIIEILFFVAGLWLIISGKVPESLFTVLFGKGHYELSSNQSRLFGLLLATPLPFAFLVGVILAILFGSDGVGFAAIFEIIYTVSVAIIAIIFARKSRQAITSDIKSPIEKGN